MPIQSVAGRVQERIEFVMLNRGWTNADLIRRIEPPPKVSSVSTWLSKGTSNHNSLRHIAKGFGCTVAELTGDDVWPDFERAISMEIWDPKSRDSEDFRGVFAKAASKTVAVGERLLAFTSELPCSWLSESALDAMYNSVFRAVTTTDPARGYTHKDWAEKLKKNYKEFGQAQREAFDNEPPGVAALRQTIMLRRSDFERMVQRLPPFDGWDSWDLIESFRKVSDFCLRTKGHTLVLLDAPADAVIAEVHAAYGRVDSLVVLGGALTFHRELVGPYPRRIKWSDDARQVSDARLLLGRLRACAPSNAEVEAVAEIDRTLKT